MVQLSPIIVHQLSDAPASSEGSLGLLGAVILWYPHYTGVTKGQSPTQEDLAFRTKLNSLTSNWKGQRHSAKSFTAT